MRKWWWRLGQLDRRRVKWIIVAGAGVLIVATSITVFQVSHGQSLDKDPVRGAAIEVHQLLDLTKQLTTNEKESNPAKITHIYLDRLQAIQQSCQRIHQYQKLGETAKLAADQQLRLNQSNALCQDLSRLASNSEIVYRATEPLLTSSTTPRRYQAIGIFGNHVRQRHLQAVAEASSQLEKRKSVQADFPSIIPAELQRLQASIKSSKGLGYMPALRGFQISVLAERQQYWGPYADAPSLRKSLEIQFTNYCQTLQNSDSSLKQCPSKF